MGSIVKGVGSLFGGRARRREESAARTEFEGAKQGLKDFEFGDFYGDLQARELGAAQQGQLSQAQGGTLGQAGQAALVERGPAVQAQLANLADAQGYQGQGYTAGSTSVGQLARGADTGLTNTMNNLQVSTAGAELAAQEADQSLAASQDLAAQAGTGAGGATALAAAAAKSKAGISADIDRQVKSNEQMRAAAESQLQQSQLAQGNLASQFDLGQQQFNVGAANDASRFGAQAQNDAARFSAQAQNQFSLSEFQAENQMNQFNAAAQNQVARDNFNAANATNQFNVGAQNQFLQSQFGADNAFSMANMEAANKMSQFNAAEANQQERSNQSQLNSFMINQAAGQADRAESQYAQQMDQFNIGSQRYGQAQQARAQATGDLLGGIGGVLSAAAGPAGMLKGIMGG